MQNQEQDWNQSDDERLSECRLPKKRMRRSSLSALPKFTLIGPTIIHTMSQIATSPSSGTKKRKHGATEATRPNGGEASSSTDVEGPSAKRSKKSYHVESFQSHAAAPVVLSAVADVTQKKKGKKKKHKTIKNGRILEGESEFHVVSASVRLSIPPVFSLDLPAGARELLDSMLMRFVFNVCATSIDREN